MKNHKCIINFLIKKLRFFVDEFLLAGLYWEKKLDITTVDQDELKMGIEVEYEHTTSNILSTKIALDHLAEIPDYYTRLAKMEHKAFQELGINEKTSITNNMRKIKSFKSSSINMHQRKLQSILKDLNSVLKELSPDTNANDIRKSDDKELFYMHSKLHSLWKDLKESNKLPDKWDRTKIIILHKAVVTTFDSKKLKHHYLSDLDDTLPSNLSKKTIKNGDPKDDSQRTGS